MEQPLVFDQEGKRYNLRKLNELAYQLVKAGRLQELCRTTLTDYEWLLAKVKATYPSELIADFDAAVPALPQGRYEKNRRLKPFLWQDQDQALENQAKDACVL